jgi:sortase A
VALLIAIAIAVSFVGVVKVNSQETAALASPILKVGSVPTLPDTTLAPTTTTPPPAPTATGKTKAVRPPGNSYAPEPIVQIGSMEIPKIGLVTPIYHGITLRNIDHGPSHWPGTPMPGEAGNSVFAGHRVTHSHPFRNIDQLVPGDLVIFTVDGVRSTYSVTGHEIVTPDALYITDPTPTPTATIFGCHPPGSARYRYVVRMSLVEQ